MFAPVLAWLRSDRLIQGALGLVYLHFGALKWFPDLSPAEMLAQQTTLRLGLGLDAIELLRILAAWECAIGVLMLFGVWRTLTCLLLLAHLAGTFLPLFVLPELAFRVAPWAPTLEGQYILKNLVFAAIGLRLLVGSQQPTLEGTKAVDPALD